MLQNSKLWAIKNFMSPLMKEKPVNMFKELCD